MQTAFFELSKLLDLLLAPLSWALLLLLAAILARRRGRLPWVLVGLAAALLYAFSLEGVADALMRRLEGPVRATYRPGETYDAVILLGGVLESGSHIPGHDPELAREADRLTRTFELLRDGRARHVLVSGGSGWSSRAELTEAEQLAALLRRWGVPSEKIVLETRSRNTRENAIESAAIVRARGWSQLLLVTSAWHMPRALGCFRKVGLQPDVLPADFAVGDGRGQGWMPRTKALDKSTEALRELFGQLVYRVVGYT